MEKTMEATIVFWGYIGIMEKTMEATIVFWGYIGIMEKKMETTIVYWGYICPPGPLAKRAVEDSTYCFADLGEGTRMKSRFCHTADSE